MEQVKKLNEILPQKYYRSVDAMIEAVKDSSMANLVDMGSGLKIDLSVLPREPYFDNVLSRRQLFDSGKGYSFWIVTPEDVILMKLLWRKDSRSQKQWDNALAVAQTYGARLDWKYLREWASQLSMSNDLQKLMVDAGI